MSLMSTLNDSFQNLQVVVGTQFQSFVHYHMLKCHESNRIGKLSFALGGGAHTINIVLK